MMGMRMPETCWAVFKWQVINLRSCCVWLVDSVEILGWNPYFPPKRWQVATRPQCITSHKTEPVRNSNLTWNLCRFSDIVVPSNYLRTVPAVIVQQTPRSWLSRGHCEVTVRSLCWNVFSRLSCLSHTMDCALLHTNYTHWVRELMRILTYTWA